MPYIKEANREAIDPHIQALSEEINSAGDLNYTITRIALRVLLRKGINYDNINALSGVLQKVQAEFDERITRPYEDLKLKQHGDVPEYSDAATRIREMGRSLPADHAADTIQAHG